MKHDRKKRRPEELWDEPPPANVGVEREVLGCLMVFGSDPKWSEQVKQTFSTLEGSDFADAVLRRAYEAMRVAYGNGIAVGTVPLVLQVLSEAGVYDNRDGNDKGMTMNGGELAGLMQNGGMPWSLAYCCKLLRKLRLQRAERTLAWELVRLAHRVDPCEWCGKAARQVSRLEQFVKESET